MLGLNLSDVTSPVGVGTPAMAVSPFRARMTVEVIGAKGGASWCCIAPTAVAAYGETSVLTGLATAAATGLTFAGKRDARGSIQHPPAMGDRRFDPPV